MQGSSESLSDDGILCIVHALTQPKHHNPWAWAHNGRPISHLYRTTRRTIQDNGHDFSTVDPTLNRYNLARQVTVPLFHSWSHSLPTAGGLESCIHALKRDDK